MYCIDIQNPISVPNITFFLSSLLNEEYGATLYYSAPPYLSLEFIGAISNSRPSDIFRTGFPVKPDVN